MGGGFSVQINKWHEHENINLIYILFISQKIVYGSL